MNASPLAEKLYNQKLISESSYSNILEREKSKNFSLNLELKTLLYAGILLLTSGLGIAVYKNIDSIGHLAVVMFIAFVSLACLGWCFMKRLPYSNEKIK